jgi:hypothetical protein
MPKFRFEVTGKAKANNVRGQEMRRLTLLAVESDAFRATGELPDGVEPAPPEGHISVLVNADFAKTFDIGDQFDLTPREA